jgi:hypothetical protein
LQLEGLSVSRKDCFLETRPASGQQWSYVWQNALGLKLFVRECPLIKGRVESLCFEASGKPLSYLFPRNNLLKFCEMLEMLSSLDERFKPTRLDTTMEFSHEMLDYDLISQACLARDLAGVKKARIIGSFYVDSQDKWFPTWYLGSEKSDKSTRIYETTEKHGYSAIRIEVQNKKSYAKMVGKMFVNLYQTGTLSSFDDVIIKDNPLHGCNKLLPYTACMQSEKEKNYEQVNNNLVTVLRDYILCHKNFNFVDKKSIKKWQSAKHHIELPWWFSFKNQVCSINRLDYKFVPDKLNISKSLDWFSKQCIGLFRVVKESFGADGANHLLRYFAKINEEKNGGGLSERNMELFRQVQALGKDAYFKMFSPQLTDQLREVGFFRVPCPLKKFPDMNLTDFLLYSKTPESYNFSSNF